MDRPVDALKSPESVGDIDPSIGEPEDKSLILEARESQLFIDLDSAAHIKIFKMRIKQFDRAFPDMIECLDIWPSLSNNPALKDYHYHVVVQLESGWEFEARLFVQLFLGSDPTKEFLSLQRFNEGYGEIVRLFLPGKEGTYAIYHSEGAETPEALIREDPTWK